MQTLTDCSACRTAQHPLVARQHSVPQHCSTLNWRISTGVLKFPFSTLIYQQSVAESVTIWGICGVFAITFIWIVQNYLHLLLRPVVSIVAIHLCMVSSTLTSQDFVCPESQNQLAHLLTKSPPFTCSFTMLCSLHWLLVSFRILFKINLVDLQNPARKTACLSSPHACCITPISLTEIEQR